MPCVALERRHQHCIGMELDDAFLIGRHTIAAIHHLLGEPMNVLFLTHTAYAFLYPEFANQSAMHGGED